MKIGDPNAKTPKALPVWAAMNDASRIAAASEVLVENGWGGMAEVVTAVPSGTVTVKYALQLPVAERGKSTRAIERSLQDVYQGVTVSLMPRVDKNRLRVLRGVKIL